MKPQIITSQKMSLDFEPYQFPMKRPSGELLKIWEHELAFSQDKNELKWLNGKLYLISLPDEISEIAESGLVTILRTDIDLFQVYRSFKSDPVLVSRNGNLFKWSPCLGTRLVKKNNSAGKRISPIGLPGDSLLYLKDRGSLPAFVPGVGRWGFSYIKNIGQRPVWSRNGFLYNCLPCSSGLISVSQKNRQLIELIHPETGKTIWECRTTSMVSSLPGIVNDILWMIDNEGRLVAIDINKGIVLKEKRLSGAKFPSGIIDEKGRYIVCNGINLIIVDLTSPNKAEIMYHGSIDINHERSCSTVTGENALLTYDDCLIIYDYYNQIFSIPIFAAEKGDFLWQSPERIQGIGISGNSLFVLQEKILTCLSNNKDN